MWGQQQDADGTADAAALEPEGSDRACRDRVAITIMVLTGQSLITIATRRIASATSQRRKRNPHRSSLGH
jgi:hypothetical protein